MKAPFPYFGGKSRIADKVWSALGQPDHYIEPFFGSGAVLLNRPDFEPSMTETVNDKDGFVCNVWRALKSNPDEVAKWCDWPVNHADLSARKLKLLANESRLLENLIQDDEWYDAKLAGYWIWAAGCWIGNGLRCIGTRPHLSCKSMGVHTILSINNSEHIYQWFRDLQQRLRRVRVVCGDWNRVCGGNWQANNHWKSCGMFFDPPYGVENRRKNVYHQDSLSVAADVNKWVQDRGANPKYRIVLTGYEEHANLVNDHGWTCENWKAGGGYATIGNGQGKENCKREMIYYSPHCQIV